MVAQALESSGSGAQGRTCRESWWGGVGTGPWRRPPRTLRICLCPRLGWFRGALRPSVSVTAVLTAVQVDNSKFNVDPTVNILWLVSVGTSGISFVSFS